MTDFVDQRLWWQNSAYDWTSMSCKWVFEPPQGRRFVPTCLTSITLLTEQVDTYTSGSTITFDVNGVPTIVKDETPKIKKWFAICLRLNHGRNTGNTVSASGFDQRSIAERKHNREHLRSVELEGGTGFSWCVRLLKLGFPEDYATRLFETFGTDSKRVVIEWQNVHGSIIDLVIAMAPVQLPAYILLWLLEWLHPEWQVHTEHLRVSLIISVVKSIREIRFGRERSTSNKK